MFRIIARAMLKDKQFEVLNSLLDRSHGKALQKLETKDTSVSDEELEARIKAYENRNGK